MPDGCKSTEYARLDVSDVSGLRVDAGKKQKPSGTAQMLRVQKFRGTSSRISLSLFNGITKILNGEATTGIVIP
jgi:hypothetical protein